MINKNEICLRFWYCLSCISDKYSKCFCRRYLKIDSILTHDFDTYYNFPKQTPLILSGNHEICLSNDCKMIYDKSVDDYGCGGVTLNVESNKMILNGFFKLTGSGYKGILGLTFQCEPIDTKNHRCGNH